MFSSPSSTASLAVALIGFTFGCTPSESGVDAMPSPGPDMGGPATPDVPQPMPEAGVDLPNEPTNDVPPNDGPPSDGGADAGDAPKPWPPPGTAYLTKLETEGDYNQLTATGRGGGVPFIIRRRGNDQPYPYPWDLYECVFEPPGIHVEFLEMMDPQRALYLYYNDAKSRGGSLIPGRLSLTKTGNSKLVGVSIENFQGLTVPSANVFFPLEPAVTQLIRERMARCVPFATSFTFSMICPDGSNCPMP
jgi:hypothetical protein